MEAKRSYCKICTVSTTLNVMLQNLEEIVCCIFVSDKFTKRIFLSRPQEDY